jgi:hypothetical protein
MELVNATRMQAGYTTARDVSGRWLLVVVVKGTFEMSDRSGRGLALAEEQVPLIASDEFYGDPGLSAPKYECDYAPSKRNCDVLLNATAYAPDGRPTDRMTVGAQIGNWSKSFSVIGNREWLGVDRSSAPVPFVQMPITYDCAFGGIDLRHESPAQHAAFRANPSGRGYHYHLIPQWLAGSPLPNTEQSSVAIARPDGVYQPMSFGPIGRHWEPRVSFAGTYDDEWLDSVFPFLPQDFDERYYQGAPADQQIPKPEGAQQLRLFGLTPDGTWDCVLPDFAAPIQIFPKHGPREDLSAHADTIVIEPDLRRVTMTWRIARVLRRDPFEISQVLVGRKGKAWWQQREEIAFPLPVVVIPMNSRSPPQ